MAQLKYSTKKARKLKIVINIKEYFSHMIFYLKLSLILAMLVYYKSIEGNTFQEINAKEKSKTFNQYTDENKRIILKLKNILDSSLKNNNIPEFLYNPCFEIDKYSNKNESQFYHCLKSEFIYSLDSNIIQKILIIGDTNKLKLYCSYKNCKDGNNNYNFFDLFKKRLIFLSIKHQIDSIFKYHAIYFKNNSKSCSLIDTASFYVYNSVHPFDRTLPYFQIFKFCSDGKVKKYNVFGDITIDILDTSDYTEFIYFVNNDNSTGILKQYYIDTATNILLTSKMKIKISKNGIKFIPFKDDVNTNRMYLTKWFYKRRQIE